MKKVFLLMCLFAWSTNFALAKAEQIVLETKIVDQKPILPGKGKAPMRMPVIYIDGYTLSLSTFHPEYIINIVQDDEVIYTSIIPEGITEYELPSYLCGECEIQFVSGSFCFTGLIVL